MRGDGGGAGRTTPCRQPRLRCARVRPAAPQRRGAWDSSSRDAKTLATALFTQIDRLAAMLDEYVTLKRADVRISATTIDSVRGGVGAATRRAGDFARNTRAVLGGHRPRRT